MHPRRRPHQETKSFWANVDGLAHKFARDYSLCSTIPAVDARHAREAEATTPRCPGCVSEDY